MAAPKGDLHLTAFDCIGECWHSLLIRLIIGTSSLTLSDHMDIIGTGIYPLSQAARLVGEEPRALRRWLQGYSRKSNGERVRYEPLWETQLKNEGLPEDVIGFRDLLELRMVSAFVRHGVDLKVI
ncbi:MAG: hypothetical protein M3R60_13975, partial [Pseudomonadota bacterium]|nr:hypothetical protein [Pseudomonadota bacterium]